MSTNPTAVQWQEPTLGFDEERDEILLKLGAVHLPPTVDPATTERVLAVVVELVNQMVEEDILPELLNPDEVDDYSSAMGYLDALDDDDDSVFVRSEAVAYEDGFADYIED